MKSRSIKKTIASLGLLLLSVMIQAQDLPNAFISSEQNIKTSKGLIYGTLLEPNDSAPYPIALIIAGSGPTDRNGNQPNLKNNSLLFLAESLCQKGIATLRYDKRMIAQSKMDLEESDLRFEDYIEDAKLWVELLKKNKKISKVFVIGHSEGSLIGMIAAREAKAAGFISIAGVSKSADEIILEQIKVSIPLLYEESKAIIDSLRKGVIVKEVNPYLLSIFRPNVQPYVISWIKYNPSIEIKKLRIPILIIQGTTDIQVSVKNAELLAAANKRAELRIVGQMNHILKRAEMDRSKNIATYMNPDLPIVEEVPQWIEDFIKKHD